MKTYCKNCNKEFGIQFKFCPVCGRKLKVKYNVDLEKAFVPYIKNTGFTLEQLRDGSQRFGLYRGDDIYKDSQKVIKRLIENKPNFLTLSFKVWNNFGKLEFTIYLEGEDEFFGGFLYLPVNKINLGLVLCLANEEDVIKLVDECQEEISLREERIEELTVALKKFKDLKKRLEEK